MAVQVQKSQLLAKLGAKLDAVVKEHAGDEVDYGLQQGLPPGIRDGVAKLVECKFEVIPEGKKYAGNLRFVMTAVMVEPATVLYNGREMPVQGRQTWVFRNVCDTTTQKGKVTTLADNVAEIMNDMKKLGAAFDPAQGAAQLEAMAAALKKASQTPGQEIYFSISTTPRKDQVTGKETGESWENWGAVVQDYAPPDAAAAAIDDQSGAGQPADDQPPSEPEAPADESGIDLDALAAEADGMSLEDALAADGPGTAINSVAVDVGGKELKSAVGAAATWADGVELIKAAAAAGEAPAEPEASLEPETWKPKKGDPCGYKAPVKNKVGKMVAGSKVTQCEITAVYNKTGTVDLQELADKKKVHKGIKLADLVQLS